MKHFLVVIFLLISFSLFSQGRVGYTINELKAEFASHKVEQGKSKEGRDILLVHFEQYDVAYFFDENGLSELTFIMPKNEEALNEKVQYFGENYISVNPTLWRKYTSGGVWQVKLLYGDDGPFFVVQLLKE